MQNTWLKKKKKEIFKNKQINFAVKTWLKIFALETNSFAKFKYKNLLGMNAMAKKELLRLRFYLQNDLYF